MATAIKIVVAIVAAVLVGTSLQDSSPGRLAIGVVFLVCIVWLVAISGGLGTIIRRDDGREVKRLEDLEDDEARKQRPHF